MTDKVREIVAELLSRRSPAGSVCPSEVARALTGDEEWRPAMPLVHEAVDGLVADKQITLSWKGKALVRRNGPYRISRRKESSAT